MSTKEGFFKRLFQRFNYRHIICIAILVLSLILTFTKYNVSLDRFVQSCIDLKNSVVYFVNVRFLKILDKPVTVNEIPEIDLLQLLPFDVDEFIRKCQAYGKNLFNKENFVSYTNGIIQPMPKIIGVGMVVVLFFMLLIKVIKALYFRKVKPKRKYKDTIPLHFSMAFLHFYKHIF